MARKKKNKKEQTFNVYPYLGGYQHFMRKGGALPKFENTGAVDASVIAKRIQPHNKYQYANTWEGVVNEYNRINNRNYVPKGSLLGKVAGGIGATVDFTKSVADVFDRSNYRPGGKWSKFQTTKIPGRIASCSDGKSATEEECTNNGGVWDPGSDSTEVFGGLKYGKTSFTNTTDQNALLHAENAEKWMNMSKKEKKDFIESGGRNTDLWWSTDDMQHGKWNWMDLNEDGTPKYDGINLRASIERGNILENQTGNRLFSNKTRVLQPDGSYKFVYFDENRNMIMNPDLVRTKYDEIEEGTGTGQLADADVTHMNISYEVDALGNPVIPSNTELTSFDHYVKGEDGTRRKVDNVIYDPNKEYGDYIQNENFQIDQQLKNDCLSRGCSYVPDATGGTCDCDNPITGKYGKELTSYLKGGGTASDGAVLCDAYDKPIQPPNPASKADYSAPPGRDFNEEGAECAIPGTCPGYDDYMYAKYGGGLPKFQGPTKSEVKAYSKSLDLNKRDTRNLLNELINQGANLENDTIIGAQGNDRQHVVDNLISNIDQYPPYFNQFSPLNMYAPELRQYPNIFGSRQAYVALPNLQKGGTLLKAQDGTECSPPEQGCPEGQAWDAEACTCSVKDDDFSVPDPNAGMTPIEIDTSKNSFNNPLAGPPVPPEFDVNANAEPPIMVADESQNTPSPNVPVISKEALDDQVYKENNMQNPNAPREAAGGFTCSDGVSTTKEECEKNNGTWNDPQDMGIETSYGGGPLQKGWNWTREKLNTGVFGAIKDTIVGQSAEQYCSDPKYKTKEECEKEGGKWTDQKGTGLVSLAFDHIMPIMKDIKMQNQERANEMHKRSVSAEDMFAATESGVGAGQKGFYDVNKGGYGDDLYGTGKIFGQIAQQGVEMMPPQDQRDFSVASAFMNLEDGVKYDLELLKQQKNYLGKMKFGGYLPKFRTTGEKDAMEEMKTAYDKVNVDHFVEPSKYTDASTLDYGTSHVSSQAMNTSNTDQVNDDFRYSDVFIDNMRIANAKGADKAILGSGTDLYDADITNQQHLAELQERYGMSMDEMIASGKWTIADDGKTLISTPSVSSQHSTTRNISDEITFDETFGTFTLPNKANQYQGSFGTSVTTDDNATYDEDVDTYWKNIGQYSTGDDNIYSDPKYRGSFLPEVVIKGAYGGQLPKANDGKEEKPWYSKTADYVQTGLTGAGLTPGWGIFADALNTGISGTRAIYNRAIGDDEAADIHTENTVANALSAVPGPTGWAAGGASLAKDIAGYTGVYDSDTSVTTKIAEGVKDITPGTTVENTDLITENRNVDTDDTSTKKVGAAKYGKEIANIDMDLYYELLRAGADIKIIR